MKSSSCKHDSFRFKSILNGQEDMYLILGGEQLSTNVHVNT